MRISHDLHAQLVSASWEEPARYAERTVAILVQEMRLAAASFWLYTEDQGTAQPMTLRAAVGLGVGGYESFELDQSFYPGQAIARGVFSRTPEELEASPRYRDKQLLADIGGGMTAGPLEVPRPGQTSSDHVGVWGPIGALCLYPHARQDNVTLERWLKDNGSFLARLYLAALERHAMGLRREIVNDVAFRKDVSSLEYNFLEFVEKRMSVEAAQLWVYDPVDRRIYLRKTMGYGNASVLDVEPIKTDAEDNAIARCFTTGTASSSMDDLPEPVLSGVSTPVNNATLTPIPLPQSARLRGDAVPSAGVLVLVNHYTKLAGIRHPTACTWEDRFLARFSCEMLSVLIYQMLKTRDYERDFERLMHGARRSLQATLQALKTIDTPRTARQLEPGLYNHIPTSIGWLEDLAAQIDRNELIGSTQMRITTLHLYNQVLAPVGAMARRMTMPPPHRHLKLTGLDQTAFLRMLPRIRGNVEALTCVFRNLVDNGVKYSERDPEREPRIDFVVEMTRDRKRLLVTVADNGIGIPDADRDDIFHDGFRGLRARAHVPSGVGRGLYDCRTLLERMDGQITLLPNAPDQTGTRFQVDLPIAPRARHYS